MSLRNITGGAVALALFFGALAALCTSLVAGFMLDQLKVSFFYGIVLPGLVVGAFAISLVLWRAYNGETVSEMTTSIRNFFEEFGRSG
jgi:hypothetical protein